MEKTIEEKVGAKARKKDDPDLIRDNRQWQAKQGGREQIILDSTDFVKKIIKGNKNRWPSFLEEGDMINTATKGLIEMINSYDPRLNVKFSTYIEIRLIGAIQDYLRKLDIVPRSLRAKEALYIAAQQEFQIQFGQLPNDEELADFMKLDFSKFVEMKKQISEIPYFISENDFNATDIHNENQPLSFLDFVADQTKPINDILMENQQAQMLKMIVGCICNRKQKIVLEKYYYDGLTMKEISDLPEMTMTESRVSQIRTHGAYLVQCIIYKLAADGIPIIDLSVERAKIMLGQDEAAGCCDHVQYSASELEKIPLIKMIPWNANIVKKLQRLIPGNNLPTIIDLRWLSLKNLQTASFSKQEISFISRLLLKFNWGFCLSSSSQISDPKYYIINDDLWDEQAWQTAKNHWKRVDFDKKERLAIWKNHPVPVSLIKTTHIEQREINETYRKFKETFFTKIGLGQPPVNKDVDIPRDREINISTVPAKISIKPLKQIPARLAQDISEDITPLPSPKPTIIDAIINSLAKQLPNVQQLDIQITTKTRKISLSLTANKSKN